MIFMKARLKKLWKGVKETVDKAVKAILTAENAYRAGIVVGCCFVGIGVSGIMLLANADKLR
jgi:hypothetical protein|nr:MAG TPA: hypothetical protein [Caudoviricetes sp.]